MWIDVFRSGEQTDSEGNTKDWTNEDLDKIVTQYNDQNADEEHRAPIVIGHPTDASPAYAWVKELKAEDGVLYADIVDVQPELKEWVDKGLYRERSIALDEDLLLVHIGFLGGVPPAVKGLTPVRFNSAVKVAHQFSMTSPFVPPADPVQLDATALQTLQQAKQEQDARAARFGIRVQETGNVIKPIAFADLTDEQFADPVNYRWPLSPKSVLIASKNVVNLWSTDYNETEKILIQARFVDAAISNGLEAERWYFKASKETAKVWAFASLFTNTKTPMDQILTGLVDWLRTTYNEETAQQTQAQIDTLKASMMTSLQEFVVTTFGEEVGTAFAAKVTELSSAAPEGQPAADPGAGSETTAAASTAGVTTHAADANKDLLVRIANLEKDKRMSEFSSHIDGLIKEGKIIAANRDAAIEQLELAHQSDAAGTTQGSVAKTLAFMRSMPRTVPMGQFAQPGNGGSQFKRNKSLASSGVTVNPESEKRRAAVEAYAEKNNLSYTKAYNKLKAEGGLD